MSPTSQPLAAEAAPRIHSQAPHARTAEARQDVIPAADAASESSDEDREQQIRQAGLDMQHAYWEYERTGDLGSLGEAHKHRIRMTELIRGRSPQQVARMEQERGIS